MRLITCFVIVLISAALARAQVFSSEFFSDPVTEGWPLYQQYCGPQTWNADGIYYQSLDFDPCGPPPPPGGGQDEYLEDIATYNGTTAWFFEFRVKTNGDHSEIPGNAPTVMTAGNFFGEGYKVNVARDRVKFLVDNPFVATFFDVSPGVPHTIRLELKNVGTPTYNWFIDGALVDGGVAGDVFPSADARITWRGKAWYLPCENAWDYIRYGKTPVDGSLDYDTSGTVDEFDLYFFQECFLDPAIQSWPGCRFADVNGDQLVDCTDWDALLGAWTAPDPPSVNFCIPTPAASQWGVTVLTLLLLSAGTIAFARQNPATYTSPREIGAEHL